MFRIKEYGELSGWRPIEMDMPLVQQTHCPCCNAPLETACALVGDNATVRVGSCPHCGYLGYIDRPHQQWFEDFYNADWDGQGKRDTDATAQVILRDYKSHDTMTELVKQSGVGKDEWLLEIGAGYGAVMQQLKEAGYQFVHGVEPSKHRRELIERVFGLYVSPDIPKHYPQFGLVYSSHVMEHCYDPAAMIRNIAELQDRGGLLSLCVPRQETEPSMGVLLFLPHLHSFNECSLLHLLNRYGYGTMEVKRDAQSIYVLAIKTGRVLDVPAGVATGVAKLRTALSAATPVSEYFCMTYRFWWNYFDDRCGYVPEGADWNEFTAEMKRPRFVYVEPCERKTDAPCEVQFEGKLRLCVK